MFDTEPDAGLECILLSVPLRHKSCGAGSTTLHGIILTGAYSKAAKNRILKTIVAHTEIFLFGFIDLQEKNIICYIIPLNCFNPFLLQRF
jgi:hypothetical protein